MIKNKGQYNPEFRNYESVIFESKAKILQKASKQAVKAGIARRKVEALHDQQRLNKELDLWATT